MRVADRPFPTAVGGVGVLSAPPTAGSPMDCCSCVKPIEARWILVSPEGDVVYACGLSCIRIYTSEKLLQEVQEKPEYR